MCRRAEVKSTKFFGITPQTQLYALLIGVILISPGPVAVGIALRLDRRGGFDL